MADTAPTVQEQSNIGRPKKPEDKKFVGLYLKVPPELAAKLDAHAEQTGIQKSRTFRHALELYLNTFSATNGASPAALPPDTTPPPTSSEVSRLGTYAIAQDFGGFRVTDDGNGTLQTCVIFLQAASRYVPGDVATVPLDDALKWHEKGIVAPRKRNFMLIKFVTNPGKLAYVPLRQGQALVQQRQAEAITVT